MTGAVIARCVVYAILCFGYSGVGSWFIKLGIEEFKRGEYFKAWFSFLLAVPQIVLLVRTAWRL